MLVVSMINFGWCMDDFMFRLKLAISKTQHVQGKRPPATWMIGPYLLDDLPENHGVSGKNLNSLNSWEY